MKVKILKKLKMVFPIRILTASLKGFIADRCFDKAATLTYYSLLSIVPIAAISFGIAQEAGFETNLTEIIKSQLQSQPEIAKKVIQFSHATLQQTKGGIVAGFGLIVLVWTVFNMISSIEVFFDEIWKVKTSRTWWQQIKRYIPLIVLFPIFLIGSNALIIYVSTETTSAFQSIEYLNSFIVYVFKSFPYIITWAILSFFYVYLPNTKVTWKAGFISGVTAGILYQCWQWIYVIFQINASSYGAIYGAFAAIPLFLIWLNYSWLIILFGVELSYHTQNTKQT